MVYNRAQIKMMYFCSDAGRNFDRNFLGKDYIVLGYLAIGKIARQMGTTYNSTIATHTQH